MKKLITQPIYILMGYVGITLIFSIIYYIAPKDSFSQELGLIKSIYFSVVTITTLGYGDITPKDTLGMISTSLESIIGILIIGIFINSTWKKFSDKMEKEQSKQIKQSLHISNKNNLSAYYSYLSSVIKDYKRATLEVTTPIDKRNEKTKYSSNFKFSDLRDILKQSLFFKNGFDKSVVEIYFDTEKELITELKYILANFGLEDFLDLKKNIIKFLNICHSSNFRDMLVPYGTYAKNNTTRKLLEEMIIKFDNLPPKDYHQSNMLTPVIILYQSIPIKMTILAEIEKNLQSISQ